MAQVACPRCASTKHMFVIRCKKCNVQSCEQCSMKSATDLKTQAVGSGATFSKFTMRCPDCGATKDLDIRPTV